MSPPEESIGSSRIDENDPTKLLSGGVTRMDLLEGNNRMDASVIIKKEL